MASTKMPCFLSDSSKCLRTTLERGNCKINPYINIIGTATASTNATGPAINQRTKMKILKELEDAKLVIVDLEVRLGEEVRSAPTLCAKYKGKII